MDADRHVNAVKVDLFAHLGDDLDKTSAQLDITGAFVFWAAAVVAFEKTHDDVAVTNSVDFV